MKYIKIFFIFIISSAFITQASALAFSNLSANITGAVNNGNGYFDDPNGVLNYTGSRNIFLISEEREINILEPVGFAGGASNAYTVITSTGGNLYDAVTHNGYIYFVEGTTLKKKKTRDFESPQTCSSNDTSAGGCIATISTSVSPTLRVYDDKVYFMSGQFLKHLDTADNAVTDFSIAAVPGGAAQYSSFAVTKNSSNSNILQTYTFGTNGANVFLYLCVSTGCAAQTGSISGNTISYATLYTTPTYLYALDVQAGLENTETLRYITNGSTVSVDYATSNTWLLRSRAYVGGLSTLGLIAQSNISYETYNSNEAGTDSLPVVPSELTYDTKTISSLDSQYYNKSDIYLQYNVVIDSLNVNNLLFNFGDYRWMISLQDPNGVITDVIQSPECIYDNALDFTCQIDSTMGIHAPPSGWLQGIWYAKLYEINTVTPNRVLLTTSSAFTVLNTSVENQSVIPPPFEPPTSGTAPQAISIIDGWVLWLGLGLNSVSKLLFAMILIAIAATVGLVWGNGNIAMVFAFIPYAFFTFIDYIPKWIFIITIILIAIVSRAFR